MAQMSVTPIDHKGRYGEGVREYWEGKVMEPQDALEGSPLAGGQVRGGGVRLEEPDEVKETRGL